MRKEKQEKKYNLPKIAQLLCGGAGIQNTICLIQSLCSVTTFTHPPPPKPWNSPFSHSVMHFMLPFCCSWNGSLFICTVSRESLSIVQGSAPWPSSHNVSHKPSQLNCFISFLWQLYNDTNHPFIHLTTYPSIHPRITNMVEDCLPRSIQTKNVL